MFSFSKKTAVPAIPNKVWKTKAQCLRGISAAAMSKVLDGGTAIVIGFFQEETKVCGDFLATNSIPHRVIDAANVSEFAAREIVVIEAGDILKSTQLQAAIQKVAASAVLLFRGRYPIPATEQLLLEKLPVTKTNGAFHLSMEDGLLKMFGMEGMVSIMERLGLKDDECVEHSFIDKAIVNAQRKLADKRSDYKTDSEEEWFGRNVHSKI